VAVNRTLMRTSFLVCSVFTICFLAGAKSLYSAPLIEPPIPLAFGVSVHDLGKDFFELAAIHEAGFRIVRKDITWDNVERSKGEYDWREYDQFAERMKAYNMRPLFILDYSNPLYAQLVPMRSKSGPTQAKAAAPTNPSEITAFAKFSALAVERYKGYDPIWEIWNEPEHDNFWPPKANPSAYASLVNVTCAAMRKVDHNATIVAPGTSEKPSYKIPSPPLLQEIFSSGLLSCIDAVSIHPYLWIPELDNTHEVWTALRQLITKYYNVKLANNVPAVINSEWGLSTFSNKISEEEQASYLIRMMLLNLASRVPVSIWYDWKDDGSDPDEAEHHFGIMRRDGITPKINWYALHFMTTELAGYRYKCRSDRNGNGVTLLVFDRDGADDWRIVVWNSSKTISAEINLPPNGRLTHVQSFLGEAMPFEGNRANLRIILGHRPVFLRVVGPKDDTAKYCDQF